MNSRFEYLCNNTNNSAIDIHLHLNCLRYYASLSDHITEMGVRSVVSTWAFLNGLPRKLVSYDIQSPPTENLKEVDEFSSQNNIEFVFHQKSVLDVEIENTDLLFIDTWHVYDQLKKELYLHSKNVNKYIILHDTETFGVQGEGNSGHRGLKYAVNEFLTDYKDEWILHEHFVYNNGLTVLKRKT